MPAIRPERPRYLSLAAGGSILVSVALASWVVARGDPGLRALPALLLIAAASSGVMVLLRPPSFGWLLGASILLLVPTVLLLLGGIGLLYVPSLLCYLASLAGSFRSSRETPGRP
jgi:hypothetical protein